MFGYNVTFAYSPTGQRANMIDPSGSTAYFYDARNRLTTKFVSFTGGPSVTNRYGYDANGNVTNISDIVSNGVNLVYSYDLLNRLTNVLANGSTAASYGFDAVGNLQTMRYGTLATNSYQYDSLNRLTNLACTTVSGTIASFYYQLGLTGNRINLSERVNGTSRTNQWQYDPLYRLTREVIIGTGTNGYGYDPIGNRTNRAVNGFGGVAGMTNQSPTYNANDWITNDNYDSNGNTTNSAGNSYQYDALNRATNALVGGIAVMMTYDGDGNRVKKTVGAITTYFLVDDRNPSGYTQVLEEYQGTTVNYLYNYGLDLISQNTGGTIYYFGYDGHGSTRYLLTSSGTLQESYAYDAYGTLIAGPSIPSTAYLYCAQQYDFNLGLYYNRARYYKPDTGRFWTADNYDGNQEDPLSLHRYLYGSDDPVNRTDPSGNDDGLDSMPNISSAIFSHLVADIDVADISSGESTPTDDVVWNPGLGGKHARFIVVRGIPTNSWSFIAPNLETFFAPHGTDFTVVYNAGIANGEWNVSGINNAVGTYGKFDFQRNMGRGQQPDGPYNYFYPAYVHASNYGVGVFMNGCGFSLDDTIRIANSFAHGESRNAGDPQQKEWWTQGWEAAHIGAYNGLGLPHLY